MIRALLTISLAAVVAAGCSRKVVVTSGPSSSDAPPPTAGPSTAATLGIPPGHLPGPGQCRIWVHGTPPGHQPPPGDCSALAARVPAGAWLVYRPTENRKHVRVSVYDARNPGVIIAIRLYDVANGRFLREETP